MKIVINKSTKVAAFIFDDTTSVVLTETQMETPDIIALDTGYNTHEVVNGDAPTQPLYWVSYALSYINNVWTIADQELYNAILPAAKIEYQRLVKNKSAIVRATRTKLLADTDWTQIADSTADKAAWATHRQALRDVTAQAGFPWTIIWPEQP